MVDVVLKCSCGKVNGRANNVSPSSGTRCVCYCSSCQSFANHLDCSSKILNENGGTDIFQMPVSHVKITSGVEQIRCLRLTPKGMFRWYTQCCQTPIGNTFSGGAPFMGVIHSFMDDEGERDNNLGSVLGHSFIKFAQPPFSEDVEQAMPLFRLLFRMFGRLAIWKLKGLNKPSAFFDSGGRPVSDPKIFNK